MKKGTIFKILWFAVCGFGNLYQIGEISADYFSYQITTTITVNFPNDFIIPSMGLCYYETQLYNWDVLEEVKPSFVEELNWTTLTHDDMIDEFKDQIVPDRIKFQGMITKGMTIKEHNVITYNSTDLFVDCLRVEEDGASQFKGSCSEIFDIVHFKYEYFTCFSFNLKTENFSSLEFLKSVRAETTSGFLYSVQSSELVNHTSDANLLFNNKHEYKRSGYFRYIPIAELTDSNTLSYDEYKNSLLPPPYVTKCSSYQGNGNITNRGECFEFCVRNESVKYFGPNILLPGIFVFEEMINENPNLEMLTVNELYSNQSLIDMKDEIAKICDQKCSSPTCMETFYVPRILTTSPYSVPMLVTQTMQSPRIDTNCEPKLSVVVFMTNIFSTFGFWIGLSVFSCYELISDLVDTIYEKFKNDVICSCLKRKKSERRTVRTIKVTVRSPSGNPYG